MLVYTVTAELPTSESSPSESKIEKSPNIWFPVGLREVQVQGKRTDFCDSYRNFQYRNGERLGGHKQRKWIGKGKKGLTPFLKKGVHTNTPTWSIYLLRLLPYYQLGNRRPFNTRTNGKGESSIEWTTLAPARKTGFKAVHGSSKHKIKLTFFEGNPRLILIRWAETKKERKKDRNRLGLVPETRTTCFPCFQIQDYTGSYPLGRVDLWTLLSSASPVAGYLNLPHSTISRSIALLSWRSISHWIEKYADRRLPVCS